MFDFAQPQTEAKITPSNYEIMKRTGLRPFRSKHGNI